MADNRLNWKRGLARLWIALAAPWIAVTGYLHYDMLRDASDVIITAPSIEAPAADCIAIADERDRAICNLERQLAEQTNANTARARSDIESAAWWIGAPPAALMVAGFILAWVARGFQARGKSH